MTPNPPWQNEPDLPPEVVEVAREATCTRCGTVVVDEPSVAGTIMFNYFLPAIGQKQRGYLCGACGLLFREFLHPELVDNEAYQAVAKALRGTW